MASIAEREATLSVDVEYEEFLLKRGISDGARDVARMAFYDNYDSLFRPIHTSGYQPQPRAFVPVHSLDDEGVGLEAYNSFLFMLGSTPP